MGDWKVPEDSNTATTSTRNSQDDPHTLDRDVRASYLALALRLLVMTGAIAALVYRWKAKNAPLLVLVIGFLVGFVVVRLHRSSISRK